MHDDVPPFYRFLFIQRSRLRTEEPVGAATVRPTEEPRHRKMPPHLLRQSLFLGGGSNLEACPMAMAQ